jgi:hypothetical protein
MAFMAAELALLRAEKVERDAELARCHKRIRQLESLTKAPPQQVNMMTSGSGVLDSFMQCHVVPWPKGDRPAFNGLRFPRSFPRRMVRDEVTNQLRLESDHEWIHKNICERSWVQMISRLRVTCRYASQFEVPGMQEFLSTARFRRVAQALHHELDEPRGLLLTEGRFPDGYGRANLCPRGIIGETYANLDTWGNLWRPYPGLRAAIEDAEEADDE